MVDFSARWGLYFRRSAKTWGRRVGAAGPAGGSRAAPAAAGTARPSPQGRRGGLDARPGVADGIYAAFRVSPVTARLSGAGCCGS